MPSPSEDALFDQVDAVVKAAFPTVDEAELVRALRRDNDMAAELTVTRDHGVVGYAALSWMQEPAGWVCLAPVAVDPAFQKRGIGGQLMQDVLRWIAEHDAIAVVLGDPAYYGARGFSVQRARNLTSPYPLEYTMIAGPGADAPTATLVYPKAFSDAG